MRVEFVVHGVAQPAGSKRAFVNRKTGRAIVTDDAKRSRPWKTTVAEIAAAAMGGRPLLNGPLELSIDVYVPRPKGHYGARGVLPSAPLFPAVRPDVTKLVRAIEDALTGIVWRDDAQIVDQHARKLYGEPAAAIVTVTTIDRQEGDTP